MRDAGAQTAACLVSWYPKRWHRLCIDASRNRGTMLTLTGKGHPEPARAEHAVILAVEDDKHIARMLELTLEGEGYRVIDAPTGQHAIEEVRTRNPDLILLDLGLPDVDGFSLVRDLRALTPSPIIVVSADHLERDKVQALDAGANDYLTKPFSTPELMARIRAGLRGRAHVEGSDVTCVEFGDCTLDLVRRRLTRKGRPVRLSPTELKLLATLARHADEIVPTDTLLKETWGMAYGKREGYVRVYIHSLRNKIEKDPAQPQYLLNETGFGYRLRASSQTPAPSARRAG
jgi:two-component system KDP operon response regulator KdpE